jgi:hypothetical protein
MKRLLFGLAIVAGLAACNEHRTASEGYVDSSSTESKTTTPPDNTSAGLDTNSIGAATQGGIRNDTIPKDTTRRDTTRPHRDSTMR